MHERKVSELMGANRLLLGVSILAVVLLGPSFIVGYLWGYRSARADAALSASEPALATTPQTEQRKPAGSGRSKQPASAARADHPAGPIYLQLVATATSRSDDIIDALRNNGFPAVAVEIPRKPGLRRVLIGPLHEGELDQTRAALRSKGFPGDSAIKTTF